MKVVVRFLAICVPISAAFSVLGHPRKSHPAFVSLQRTQRPPEFVFYAVSLKDDVETATEDDDNEEVNGAPGFEDVSGLFGSSYVPAGLTSSQYKHLQEQEAAKHAAAEYGAWGPRFKRSEEPVSNDMAWMTMPDLWTGANQPLEDIEVVRSVDEDEDIPFQHVLDAYEDESGFWTDHVDATSSAWKQTPDAVSDSWKETYDLFCKGETVNQMVVTAMKQSNDKDIDVTTLTCELTNHILQGLVAHGPPNVAGDDSEFSLKRIVHHCAPSKADWEAMHKAEVELLHTDVTLPANDHGLLTIRHSRDDFLTAIRQAAKSDDNSDDDDSYDAPSEMETAEQHLCMDWYIALRRLGVQNPF